MRCDESKVFLNKKDEMKYLEPYFYTVIPATVTIINIKYKCRSLPHSPFVVLLNFSGTV